MAIQLMQGDCLELMQSLPEKSIDLIFTDLPYGTTRNAFDVPLPLKDYICIGKKQYTEQEYMLYAYKNGIPFRKAKEVFAAEKKSGLWTHYNRIIKDNGVIALFAQQPYASILGDSNPSVLRYEWCIEKTRPTGYLNCRRAPMKAHENILIFYKHPPKYNPQFTAGHPPAHTYNKADGTGSNYGEVRHGNSGGGTTLRFPRDVLKFKWDTQRSKLHTNQKPVAVLEYIIRTYTDRGDTVLDSCMGSGSTGEACLNTGRDFIGMELAENIFLSALKRLTPVTQGKITTLVKEGYGNVVADKTSARQQYYGV